MRKMFRILVSRDVDLVHASCDDCDIIAKDHRTHFQLHRLIDYLEREDLDGRLFPAAIKSRHLQQIITRLE